MHSGDPSFYGAIAEQVRRLRALGIDYDVTPGVPAFAAAAAALGQELTLPGIAQSVVLTRTAVRASPMPPGESLAAFAATGATLAIHLSINNLAAVVRELAPVCGGDCPAVVVYRASWPDQQIVRAHARDDLRAEVKRLRHHPHGADPGRPRARSGAASTTAASTPPTTTTCCARAPTGSSAG